MDLSRLLMSAMFVEGMALLALAATASPMETKLIDVEFVVVMVFPVLMTDVVMVLAALASLPRDVVGVPHPRSA